ncbi:MAG: pentapeptide repeat-containing protein [Candidatus Nanopelagicales bacterium]
MISTVKFASVTAAALTVGLLATACGMTGSPEAAQEPDRNAGTDCDVQFPGGLRQDLQYYALSFQLASCLPNDIPLSVDVGAPRGTGTPIGTGLDGQAKGAAIAWNMGTDGSMALGTPTTTIPKGGGGAYGSLVGFTTVPSWNGFTAQLGPCANSIVAENGQGSFGPGNFCEVNTSSIKSQTELLRRNDFKGSWAIYLPTATLLSQVETGVPFPYVPQYNQTTDPKTKPGAIGTGVALARFAPGRSLVPFFTEVTKPYGGGPAKSPSDASFIPSTCTDNLVVKNGSNNDYRSASNWSTKMVPGGSNPYNVTINTDLSNAFAGSVLLFPSGWLNTSAGKYQTIPLGDTINKPISQKPHQFQASLKELAALTCDGSTKTNGIAMVGATVDGLSVGASKLYSPLIANSSVGGLRMKQAVAEAPAEFVFSQFSDSTGGDTSTFANANLGGANLTGALLDGVNLSGASLQQTKLYYADLSKAEGFDDANVGNAKYCHTLLPDGWANDDCDDMPGQEKWPDLAAGSCHASDCFYTSVFNNTTRMMTRGLMTCDSGKFAGDLQASQTIAPLETGRFGMVTKGGAVDKANINCSLTYANGPWGKVQVNVSNTSGAWKADVGPGYCANSDANQCLPKAAPTVLPKASPVTETPMWPPARTDNAPVKVSTRQYKAQGRTLLDIILCEPEAYGEQTDPTTGEKYTGCSPNAALPLPSEN